MTRWHLQTLNARNALTFLLPEIRAAGNRAVALASAHAPLPSFDLVVKARAEAGEAGLPVSGYAPVPGLIELSFHPDDFTETDFIRALVHEMHHLMRWDGPGYGDTLGEALVSEGLAGHFVLEVLGGAPDPWDRVTPDAGLPKRALGDWARRDYRHQDWFFGAGDLPKWAGYGLGYALIAQHLARNPGASAASLAREDAEAIRPTLRAMVMAKGRDG